MDPNLLVEQKHSLIALYVSVDVFSVLYVQQMLLFLPFDIFDLILHDQFYSA
jgi:hypothetical protein